MGARKDRLTFSGLALAWSLMISVNGDWRPDKAFGASRDQEIENRLSDETERLKAAHEKERDVLEQLSCLEQDVSAMRRSIQELSLNIQRSQTKAEAMEKQLSELGSSKAKAEAQMAKRLAAMYKYSRNGYLTVIVNAEDLHEFSRRTTYARAVMSEDMRAIEELVSKKAEFEKEIARVRSEVSEHETSMNRERARISGLKTALDTGVLNLIKIRREKEFYETAVRELQLASNDVNRAMTAVGPVNSPVVRPDSSLEEFKGRLDFPLEGNIVRAQKFLKREDFRLSKGIFIEASGSTDVTAVFPGKVEFSGKLKGYGEIIIINHGSRFFTISAFLSRRLKEKGNEVGMGELIGTAGRGGAEGVRLLYFEIREAEKSLDPVEWLKSA